MNFSLILLFFLGLIGLLFFGNSSKIISKKRLKESDRELFIAKLTKMALFNQNYLNNVVDELSSILNVQYSQVWQGLPKTNVLVLQAGKGWQGIIGEIKIAKHDCTTEVGYVLNNEKSLIIEDFKEETRFVVSELLQKQEIVSGIMVAIATVNETFGVLGLYSQKKRLFTLEELEFLTTVSNILAQALANEQQKTKLELLERAINATNHGIIISEANNPTYPVVYANAGFEKISGYQSREIIGNNYSSLQGLDSENIELSKLNRVIERGKESQVLLPSYHQDGTLFWSEIELAPIYDDRNQITHFLTIQTDITQRKFIEEALRLTQFCLDKAKDPVFWITPNAGFFYVNDAARKLLGYSSEELLNKKTWELILGCSSHRWETYWQVLKNKGSFTHETQLIAKNGKIVPVEASLNYVKFNGKDFNCAFVRNITERKKFEESLKESEELFRSIFEQAAVGIVQLSPDGKFMQINPGFSEIVGYSAEELSGLKFTHITHPCYAQESLEGLQKLLNNTLKSFTTEKSYLHKDGKKIWCQVAVSLVRDELGNPKYFIGVITNINERKKAEAQLRYNALYDSLTGLPNRTLFLDRLQKTIIVANKTQDAFFAVLFLNLDDFKGINDSFGHAVGDKLLQAIAHRLESCVSPRDTLARLGADEFAILLHHIANQEDAIAIAEKIERALATPFNILNRELSLDTSIGIALSNRDCLDGEKPENMLRDADTAMHYAKAQGKGRYVFFHQQMYQKVLNRLELKSDLRKAIEQQQFLVYYQPIVNLQKNSLCGFEALIRWDHPQKGMISPKEFIPLAEETGLILPLSSWMLNEVCQQIQTWQSELILTEELKISINLSGKQLQQINLVEQVDKILTKNNVPGIRLKLELTESMLLENVEEINQILSQLQERNIEISLDDFGTGYCSLNYLKNFGVNVNTIKIDRSFVHKLGENKEIIQAIINLARDLCMDTTAEGIETQEQLQKLKTLGCDTGQGYLFAKPLNVKAATNLLQQPQIIMASYEAK